MLNRKRIAAVALTAATALSVAPAAQAAGALNVSPAGSLAGSLELFLGGGGMENYPAPVKPTPNPTPTPTPTPTPDPVEEVKGASHWEHVIFTQLNEARKDEGLKPLLWSPKMHADGKSWAEEMGARNVFYHDPNLRILNQGENIYYTTGTTPAGAHKAFMNSPGHRANILHPPYRKVAVAVHYQESTGKWYVVQRFDI